MLEKEKKCRIAWVEEQLRRLAAEWKGLFDEELSIDVLKARLKKRIEDDKAACLDLFFRTKPMDFKTSDCYLALELLEFEEKKNVKRRIEKSTSTTK